MYKLGTGVGSGRKWVPSGAEKGDIKVGDFAKMAFLRQDDDPKDIIGEEMWVEVTGIDGDRYEGRLANVPRQEDFPAKYGSLVEFGPDNILDIIYR